MKFSASTVKAVALLASVAPFQVSATYYNTSPCPDCPPGTTKKLFYVLATTDDDNTFPFTFSGNFLSFDPHNADYCFDHDVDAQYRIDPNSFDTPNPFVYGGMFENQIYFAGGAFSGNSYADDILAKFEHGSEARQVCRFKEDGHFHVEVNRYGQWCKDNNNAGSGCVQDIVFDQQHSFVRNVQLAIECCMGCGNGIVEDGEQCDDGNDVDNDGCSNSCTLPASCGNGIVEAGEQCDDGNMVDNDGCTNSCEHPICGDGIVQPGEQCDDGNTVADDGCTNDCEYPRCGDGIVQAGEQCDDGNIVANDGCTNSCELPRCGDGIVQAGEQCDDGNTVDDDQCSNSCELPNTGGGGGDPHIQRWNQKHDTFHGECDMVFLKSSAFHDGTGLDLHVRSTIEKYFSFFETAAFRIGGDVIELYSNEFFVNGMKLGLDALPFTFGNDSKYKLTEAEIPAKKNANFYTYYKLSWEGGKSHILFMFYKKFLTISVSGHAQDFEDSVGLLGEYHTGNMIDRDGEEMSNFQAFGFEWQVDPEDPKLFVVNREPQLPFEKCRMPTAPRPARRALRGEERKLQQEAMVECAEAADVDLCVLDVMSTGDIGLATLWATRK